MDILLGLVSFLTGVTVIIQSAVNGRLRSMTANPIFASAASFGGGLLLLFLMLFAAHWLGIYTIPALSALGQTRPWMYIGGLIGTALVIGSIVIPKKIGFTAAAEADADYFCQIYNLHFLIHKNASIFVKGGLQLALRTQCP